MITMHILQYSYGIMTGCVVVLIVRINCTAVDGWKKCTKVMTVATEFVQKWCYSGNAWCAVQR
jgi:hypothetical protein